MIIRETTVTECWCEHCGAGQMEQIFKASFAENEPLRSFKGREFICKDCGKPNIIEDHIILIPIAFLVHSGHDISKHKSNADLKNFLDS